MRTEYRAIENSIDVFTITSEQRGCTTVGLLSAPRGGLICSTGNRNSMLSVYMYTIFIVVSVAVI